MANILIVDDDDAARGILLELLSERYDCHSACNAKEAFQYLEVENYDAVVSDIAMPGLTGVEILKRLQLKDLHTPVILISGRNDERDPQTLINLGAFAFLLKPLSVDEIKYIVDRAVASNGGSPQK